MWFEVLTTVKMLILVFGVVTPCGLVDRFSETLLSPSSRLITLQKGGKHSNPETFLSTYKSTLRYSCIVVTLKIRHLTSYHRIIRAAKKTSFLISNCVGCTVLKMCYHTKLEMELSVSPLLLHHFLPLPCSRGIQWHDLAELHKTRSVVYRRLYLTQNTDRRTRLANRASQKEIKHEIIMRINTLAISHQLPCP